MGGLEADTDGQRRRQRPSPPTTEALSALIDAPRSTSRFRELPLRRSRQLSVTRDPLSGTVGYLRAVALV
jgi:hypothetical protein